MLLSGQPLSLREIAAIADCCRRSSNPSGRRLRKWKPREQWCARAAEDHLPVYGINTGFGKLCESCVLPGDETRRACN